mmetsp:Transcript_21903/g.27096  ORF Transcript_21903/g.27096 Transcript_21903/m.27096 type:complete len:126 (+) Transcript_21903:73-450(+)
MAVILIAYKTRYQNTVAQSSTEADYVTASNGCKMALHICSVLEDLGCLQQHGTVLFEDNQGALFMANAGQPTKRTKHIDIKRFALQDWVEQDLITLSCVPSLSNCADTLTKCNPRILFITIMTSS